MSDREILKEIEKEFDSLDQTILDAVSDDDLSARIYEAEEKITGRKGDGRDRN